MLLFNTIGLRPAVLWFSMVLALAGVNAAGSLPQPIAKTGILGRTVEDPIDRKSVV